MKVSQASLHEQDPKHVYSSLADFYPPLESSSKDNQKGGEFPCMPAQSQRGQEQQSLTTEAHSHRQLTGQAPNLRPTGKTMGPREANPPALTHASPVESGSFKSQHGFHALCRATLTRLQEHPGMGLRPLPQPFLVWPLSPPQGYPQDMAAGHPEMGSACCEKSSQLAGEQATTTDSQNCTGALSAAPSRSET